MTELYVRNSGDERRRLLRYRCNEALKRKVDKLICNLCLTWLRFGSGLKSQIESYAYSYTISSYPYRSQS